MIKLENVSKVYNDEVVALRDASFDIPKGNSRKINLEDVAHGIIDRIALFPLLGTELRFVGTLCCYGLHLADDFAFMHALMESEFFTNFK